MAHERAPTGRDIGLCACDAPLEGRAEGSTYLLNCPVCGLSVATTNPVALQADFGEYRLCAVVAPQQGEALRLFARRLAMPLSDALAQARRAEPFALTGQGAEMRKLAEELRAYGVEATVAPLDK